MRSSEQILKLIEVKKTTGLSSSTIYRLIAQGDFPKQIKLGERSSGWLESEVQQWLVDRITASRGEAA
jgi:prophage regulatory protein